MGFLTGKTAIITGAGRAVLSDGSCGSIGYGIATAFAKQGANLVITGRNVKKLEEAKNELEAKYGIRVLPVQADVCAGTDNEATVQNVVNQAVDTFGGIQVLVNNAQASASGVPLAEHTTEQFDLALYSGLYAAFYYMKACYPYLAKSKGSVINFASGAGLFGNFGQCAYAAAKEGIRGLSRVAATEWGKDGINVNVICPLAWTAKLEQFQQVLEAIHTAGFETGIIHAAGSYALLHYDFARMDGVRAGSALLGRCRRSEDDGLVKVGCGLAPLTEVRWLPKGHTVGSGRSVTLKRATRVAVLPVGYLNGFGVAERPWDNDTLWGVLRRWRRDRKRTVRIGGQKVKIIGSIGAAETGLNVTDLKCSVGDLVSFDIDPLYAQGFRREYR